MKLEVPLSRKARRALLRAGKARITIVSVFTPITGGAQRAQSTITIRSKKPAKHRRKN
jgi:hypothetical protein